MGGVWGGGAPCLPSCWCMNPPPTAPARAFVGAVQARADRALAESRAQLDRAAEEQAALQQAAVAAQVGARRAIGGVGWGVGSAAHTSCPSQTGMECYSLPVCLPRCLPAPLPPTPPAGQAKVGVELERARGAHSKELEALKKAKEAELEGAQQRASKVGGCGGAGVEAAGGVASQRGGGQLLVCSTHQRMHAPAVGAAPPHLLDLPR